MLRVVLFVLLAVCAAAVAEGGAEYELLRDVRLERGDPGHLRVSFGPAFEFEWGVELEVDSKLWMATEGPSYHSKLSSESRITVPNNMYEGTMVKDGVKCVVRMDVRDEMIRSGMFICDRFYYLTTAEDYFGGNERGYVLYTLGERARAPISEDNERVGEVQAVDGDGTFTTFPGIALYADAELLKEFPAATAQADASAYVNSMVSQSNAILQASGMKQLTVIGSIIFLSESEQPAASITCPYTVASSFLGTFKDDIRSLCDNNQAYDGNIPDIAIMFTGRALASSVHGFAFTGKACMISYANDIAPSNCRCAALEYRASFAGGVVDMCSDISNAATRARFQVHYTLHQVGHLLGSEHISTNDYLYNFPQSSDWIMADHDDYNSYPRPLQAAMFHSSSRTQCMNSCVYVWGLFGPTFVSFYTS